MRKYFLIGMYVAGALFFNTVSAQDMNQSQVPSIVVNNFQQQFSKAYDIEWEKEVAYYKVEFELGANGRDHEVWYDAKGNMVKHKEEISKGELPKAVHTKIGSEFSGHRIDDTKKITEGSKVIYSVELKSTASEWKVLFDKDGNVISKLPD